MKNNKILLDKIDAYLKGKMSTQEIKSFESVIATDDKLAEMVEMQRFEMDAMEELVAEDLKSKIQNWKINPPVFEPEEKKIAKPKWGWAFAALVILLMVAGLFYVYNNHQTPASSENPDPAKTQTEPTSNPSSNKVESKPKTIEKKETPPVNYAEKETPIDEKKAKENPTGIDENPYELLAMNTYEATDSKFSNLSQLRSGTEGSTESVLSLGIAAFKDKKNIEVAIAEFQKIDKAQYPDEYQIAQRYLAHAYFQKEAYQKAIPLFQSMANQSESTATTRDEAEWFLTLSLLSEYPDHQRQVDALIEKMIDPDNYHHHAQDAAELKIKLSEIK